MKDTSEALFETERKARTYSVCDNQILEESIQQVPSASQPSQEVPKSSPEVKNE